MIRSEERFYTLHEIADRLQVSYMTMFRHVQEGKLVAHKIGHQWRVSESDLQEYLSERRQERS